MRSRFAEVIIACAAFAVLLHPLFAQLAPQPPESGLAPRRPEGTPDFSGLWLKETGFGFVVVGEDPAMLPWARARYEASRRGVLSPEERPRGDLERATSEFSERLSLLPAEGFSAHLRRPASLRDHPYPGPLVDAL
jgi:hypothetical protein